jgi:hypothetical protein
MTLDEIAAKLEINEALARYCRGIDRCDLETLKSVFWSDAITDYGDGDAKAWAWCENVVTALRRMEHTQHAISNVLIDLHGDTANVETYCRAYHETRADNGFREMMVGGRYLDRFMRRNGEWRILHRQYVMDFNQNGPSTAQWDNGLYAGLKIVGKRRPDDALYAPRPRA